MSCSRSKLGDRWPNLWNLWNLWRCFFTSPYFDPHVSSGTSRIIPISSKNGRWENGKARLGQESTPQLTMAAEFVTGDKRWNEMKAVLSTLGPVGAKSSLCMYLDHLSLAWNQRTNCPQPSFALPTHFSFKPFWSFSRFNAGLRRVKQVQSIPIQGIYSLMPVRGTASGASPDCLGTSSRTHHSTQPDMRFEYFWLNSAACCEVLPASYTLQALGSKWWNSIQWSKELCDLEEWTRRGRSSTLGLELCKGHLKRVEKKPARLTHQTWSKAFQQAEESPEALVSTMRKSQQPKRRHGLPVLQQQSHSMPWLLPLLPLWCWRPVLFWLFVLQVWLKETKSPYSKIKLDLSPDLVIVWDMKVNRHLELDVDILI